MEQRTNRRTMPFDDIYEITFLELGVQLMHHIRQCTTDRLSDHQRRHKLH